MSDNTTTEISTRDVGNLATFSRSNLMAPVRVEGLDIPIPRWAAIIPFDADRDAIAERIAMRAFEATSVEDMLEPTDTIPIEGLIGNHIRVDAVSLQKSTVEEEKGIGVYSAVEFTSMKDGAKGVFTTSSKGVMMQLANAIARGWIPFECTIAEVDTGKNGRSNPLHLARVVDF